MKKTFTKPPKSKVELHVHLDGAIRPSTIFDTAKRRNILLTANNVQELEKQLMIAPHEGTTLMNFLHKFSIFMPVIAGDEEAVKRIAYEWCEDSAREGIVYSEVRYSPHFLASPAVEDGVSFSSNKLSPDRVVQLVCQGLEDGCRDFKTKVRSILCCIYQCPEWSAEVLDLCIKYREHGIVGIDIAADEQPVEIKPTATEHIHVFEEAKRLDINRTVHAGEQGSVHNILEAVDRMHANRIGHGYKVVDDYKLMDRLNKSRMHFEMCPMSSYCTGSVQLNTGYNMHPLHRLIEGGFHYSLNTDDPIITGAYLSEEYQFTVDRLGVTWTDIHQANLYAAEASFLPSDEKQDLLNSLKEEYGLTES